MPGFKRFKEKTYQKMKISSGSFTPTANERNEKMMGEASKFAQSLKQCKAHVESLKKATEGMLNTTQAALSAPLPHVYERDPQSGRTTPIPRPEADAADTASNLKQISRTTTQKMEGEVLKPMTLWLKSYSNVRKMMTYAENLRLDYDADRRSYNSLERKKTSHHQKRDPNGEETVKYTTQGVNIERKMDHRDAKLEGTRDAWLKYEQTVYDKLSALVKDAGSLREFLAIVLNIQEDAYSEAASVAHAVNTGTPLARSLAASPVNSRPTTPTRRSEHSSPLADTPEEPSHPYVPSAAQPASGVATPEKQYPSIHNEPAGQPATAQQPGGLPPTLKPEDSALHEDEFPQVPKGKPPPMHNIQANHHESQPQVAV